MRTNIDIDEELLQKVMKGSGLKTKKAVVDQALNMLLRLQNQGESFDELKGLGWEGDLEEMRLGWSATGKPL